MTAPLILTLAMDEASQERFERLRRAFFPPERNLVPTHLTLFHHLPRDRARGGVATVEEACRQQEPMISKALGLLFMERGVAYKLDSSGLVALRKRLAEKWEPRTTRTSACT